MKLGLSSVLRLTALSLTAYARQACAGTPPVDCHHAKTTVTREICASPELVAMDREIAALNDRGMAQFDAEDKRRLAQSQFAFFKHRNGCDWAAHHSAHPGPAIDECVRADMDERLRLLRLVVDRGGFARR